MITFTLNAFIDYVCLKHGPFATQTAIPLPMIAYLTPRNLNKLTSHEKMGLNIWKK